MRTAVRSLSLLLLVPAAAQAQGTLTLRGFAYDSVASRPLAGAMITLNSVRSAFSDERGAFAFDSVAAGTHTLDMTHAVLDSMGLPGVAARIQFADAQATVTLAVPSFATLWRAACGARPAPADSGFVYGSVRSARDGSDVSRAGIELSWSDLTVVNIRRVTGKRFRAETETDANGEYSVCGVPLDAAMRLQSKRADLASAMIDLAPTNLRVIRRDLLLGPVDTANAGARGTISGTVTSSQGGPFEGATIVLDDTPQSRTGADGKFALANVVAGTHQVEVLGIGAKPQLFVVDVLAGGSAEISAVLERVTTLDVVRVIGSPWQVRVLEAIELRKKSGFARMIDSTTLRRRTSMGTVYAGINGVRVRPGRSSQDYTIEMTNGDGDPCTPNIRIDGIRADMEQLLAMDPAEVGVTEVYPKASSVPIELQGGVTSCGMIVVWTKRFMP
jgi:hypothetical protein